MEKYLLLIQERDHFIRTDKYIALMNKKNQRDINDHKNVLNRKIDEFHSNIESLNKNKNIEFFFKIKSLYDEMKTSAFDILKIISSLLIEWV